MEKVCNIERCMGCMACENICPVNAIEKVKNDRGFYEPKINKKICINCKMCQSMCPEITDIVKVEPISSIVCSCSAQDKDLFALFSFLPNSLSNSLFHGLCQCPIITSQYFSNLAAAGGFELYSQSYVAINLDSLWFSSAAFFLCCQAQKYCFFQGFDVFLFSSKQSY